MLRHDHCYFGKTDRCLLSRIWGLDEGGVGQVLEY